VEGGFMKIEIEDIQPEGVIIRFPDGFVFDDYQQAVTFAELVRQWHLNDIEKNRQDLFKLAENYKKGMRP
jgi:hypothetical protein